MKRIEAFMILLFAICWTGCSSNSGDGHEHDVHGEEVDESGAHDGHDHSEHSGEHGGEVHEGEITLMPEVAKDFGVKVGKLTPADFREVLKVGGMIEPAASAQTVVSASLSGIFRLSPGVTTGSAVSAGTAVGTVSSRGIQGGDANAASAAAVEAAKRELDRIEPLYRQGIVTAKDYEEARTRLVEARALNGASAGGGVLRTSAAGVVTQILAKPGQFVNVGDPVAVVASNTRLSLRADVPQKHTGFLPRISSANFRPDYSDEVISLSSMNGRLLSAPVAAVAAGGYIPVYFSFDSKGKVIPGSFTEVYLLGAPRRGVLAVPLSSIVEIQGNKYVYTKVHEDAYRKNLVKTGGSDGMKAEVLSGLREGDMVVTEGANVVRMAESSGQAIPGHTHNH